jgi:hypothetical protein
MQTATRLAALVLVALVPCVARADADEIAKLRADIEELQAQAAAREAAAAKEPSFHIYGFMDAGLQKLWAGEHAAIQAILPSNDTTFVLGNISLYLDFHPSESWSAFLEVSLTNLPDGEDVVGTPTSPYTRISTQSFNLTSAGGVYSQIRLGSIVIERAYVEWRESDYFTLRVGEFLTPYGIWNVDHGTPTLIALMLPQFIQQQWFPSTQVGIAVVGVHHFAPWELAYRAYASNGRTPTQLDLTDDKAVGGRIVLRRRTGTPVAFGLSFFAGSYSDQTRNIASYAPYTVARTEIVAYSEQGLAADAALDLGPLRVRSELVAHRVVYDVDKRDLVFGIPGTFWSNRLDWDWYGLAAYQLPWLGLEPFLYFEVERWPTILGELVVIPSVGLNIHFTPEAQLKLQAEHQFMLRGPPGADSSENDINVLATRLVLAF